MGVFRSLEVRCRYKSPEDDILREFLIPVLSGSKAYYRVAGFFSSGVLSAAAKGVAAFVRSGDAMQLIVGGVLDQRDVDAINLGLSTPAEVLERNLGSALDDVEDALVSRRLEVLAWLVSTGKLDIRVALPLDRNGRVLPTTVAYWHKKFAIFQDAQGDQLQIEGSINETSAGWTANSEAFSVHKSWVEGQGEYVRDATEEFRQLWQGQSARCLVIDMPSAARLALLKYRPAHAPSVESLSMTASTEAATGALGSLWPHQQSAVEAWIGAGNRGILAMATGCGKTRAALACLNALMQRDPVTVVLVPTLQLVTQWAAQVNQLFPAVPTVLCSSQTEWVAELPRRLVVHQGPLFAISTMQTASRSDFRAVISRLVGNQSLLLLVDEVHHIGAPEYGKVLDWCDPGLGRIGLSATPERAWDTVGTERTLRYFGGVVYTYSLADAIRQGYLSKYYYFPRFVSLDDDELARYLDLSRQIAKRVAVIAGPKGPDIVGLDDSRLQLLLINRARILKSARQKTAMAAKILLEEQLSRVLVYCDTEQQIDALADVLEPRGVALAAYTASVASRGIALDRFSKGHVDVLLAIKCLDEGIDIPWCRDALIIASSRNTAEFIQRRGRILRRHAAKAHARIFDIGVLPFDPKEGPSPAAKFERAEISIVSRELDRVQLFLQDAENSLDQLLEVLRIRDMVAKAARADD